MAPAMLTTTSPREGNMFQLAANLTAAGFIVRDGQARAARSVHVDKQAAEKRTAERRAEGQVAWCKARGILR